jgi:hypothetical protein
VPRATRPPRITCESCGILLGPDWFAHHSRTGHQRLCRDCVTDALARAEAERRLQRQELERMWELEPGQLGGDDDDVERVTSP